MSSDKYLTKERMIDLLTKLGKEYRKNHGEETEIILVGGASVIINYGFRKVSTDIDAMYEMSSILKESIKKIADDLELDDDWLNNDFRFTKSFTNKIVEFSKYYRTFSNILHVRIITGEFLLAMKMVSFRPYKNDRSDIIGIIKAHRESGYNLSMDIVNDAIKKLYGDGVNISEDAIKFVEYALNNKNLDSLYDSTRRDELLGHEIVHEVNIKYNHTVFPRDELSSIVQTILDKRNDEPTE